MSLSAQTAIALRNLLDRVVGAITAGQTVTMNTALADCYPGVGDGQAVPVTIDVTGNYTLPTGGTLVIQVLKQDPNTGQFAVILTTVSVDTTGKTTVSIPASSHGITPGGECGTFMLQFVVTFPPGGPNNKFFGGQSFQICPNCTPAAPPAPPSPTTSKAQSRKKA